MRRITLLPALGLGLALLAKLVQVQAQAPEMHNPTPPAQPGGLNGLIQSSREDINAAYAVTPEAGPWMICVASYMGESAAELAYQLCTYLRQKNYPAYVYNRGSAERKKLQEELDQQQKMLPGVPRRRILAHPEEEQFVVLLGGFRDLDAASAQLKKVRTWDLPDIKLKSGKPAFDTYDIYEPRKDKKYELKRYPVNPFHTAMVVPNPTLPPQRRQAAKVDPLWRKLNAHEPRSLFKCPKPWTLAVQEFHGACVIQPASSSGGFLEKLGLGDHPGKQLDNAARMAQEVCDMFRKLGFKSYVLHTRYNSVVTVGEFDSINDPALLRTQEQLRRMSFKTKSGETAFNLFATALPMEVPR
jgi:cell division septation protein DedD